MRRRRTNGFQLPKIDLDRLNLPKVNLPKANLPALKLPKISVPGKPLLIVGAMIVLILAMMNLNQRLSEYYRLTSQRNAVQAQVDDLQATKLVLQTQLAYSQSEAAVEAFARDSHLVREGEKLVVVLTPQGGDSSAQATPSAADAVKPIQNWEVWWALFFGQKN